MTDFVIITPAKNEEFSIPYTLESVVNQTLLPKEWIIVNDASEDSTAEIVRSYTVDYPWIKLYNYPGLPENDYSSRVVLIFNYGLNLVSCKYNFILKLDGDVSFEKDFCEKILSEFNNNSRLGIASGTIIKSGIPEKSIQEFGYTRGATKFYRKKCFDEIGGIIPVVSWDTVDNAAARSKSWQTRSLPAYFVHHKEEGSRVGGKLFQHYRTGLSNGNIPYYLPYFLLKCLSKVRKKPYFFGSIAQFIGFIYSAYFRRIRPFPEYASIQVRNDQRNFVFNFFKSLKEKHS
jgi:poly-beta-1,6-N-acetyl-D-glucosamine synthase